MQWPLVSGVAILPRTFATSWYKSDDEGERGEKEAYQTLPSAGNLPSTGLASLEGVTSEERLKGRKLTEAPLASAVAEAAGGTARHDEGGRIVYIEWPTWGNKHTGV